MPNIECLNSEIAEIKKTVDTQAQRLSEFGQKLDANTLITEGVKSDTKEIVELMKWGKTSRNVVLWVGTTIAGVWAVIEGIRHFK